MGEQTISWPSAWDEFMHKGGDAMTMAWAWGSGGTHATQIHHTIKSNGKGLGTNTGSCTLDWVLHVTLARSAGPRNGLTQMASWCNC